MKAKSTLIWTTSAIAAGVLFSIGQALAQQGGTEADNENHPAMELSHKIAVMPSKPVDAHAARLLARNNGCFRCHAIQRQPEKVGPDWEGVGERFRPLPAVVQPIAQERLIYHLISGEKANFPDGHSEHHRFIHTNPPEDPVQIKNLVDWILSL